MPTVTPPVEEEGLMKSDDVQGAYMEKKDRCVQYIMVFDLLFTSS